MCVHVEQQCVVATSAFDLPQSDIGMFLSYYCGGSDLSATEAELPFIESELFAYGPTLLERMGIS